MPGKKAHHPKGPKEVGMKHGGGRKSDAQTPGQYGRDVKGRIGQYQDAGNPPLIKK